MSEATSSAAKFRLVTTYTALMGQLVIELRQRAGWDQQTFADHSGIPQSTLSRIERGEGTITLEHVFQIAKGAGIAPSQLVQAVEDLASKAKEDMAIDVLNKRDKANKLAKTAVIAGAALGTLLVAGASITGILSENIRKK